MQFKVRHGDLLAHRSLFRLSPGIGLSMGYREDDKRRLGPNEFSRRYRSLLHTGRVLGPKAFPLIRWSLRGLGVGR